MQLGFVLQKGNLLLISSVSTLMKHLMHHCLWQWCWSAWWPQKVFLPMWVEDSWSSTIKETAYQSSPLVATGGHTLQCVQTPGLQSMWNQNVFGHYWCPELLQKSVYRDQCDIFACTSHHLVLMVTGLPAMALRWHTITRRPNPVSHKAKSEIHLLKRWSSEAV